LKTNLYNDILREIIKKLKQMVKNNFLISLSFSKNNINSILNSLFNLDNDDDRIEYTVVLNIIHDEIDLVKDLVAKAYPLLKINLIDYDYDYGSATSLLALRNIWSEIENDTRIVLLDNEIIPEKNLLTRTLKIENWKVISDSQSMYMLKEDLIDFFVYFSQIKNTITFEDNTYLSFYFMKKGISIENTNNNQNTLNTLSNVFNEIHFLCRTHC
jgi:hypothetical protein